MSSGSCSSCCSADLLFADTSRGRDSEGTVTLARFIVVFFVLITHHTRGALTCAVIGEDLIVWAVIRTRTPTGFQIQYLVPRTGVGTLAFA